MAFFVAKPGEGGPDDAGRRGADGDGGRRYGARGNRLAGAVQKSRERRAGAERAQAAENGAPGDPSERYVRHSD